MKGNSTLEIIKSRIFSKKNILFFIIITFLFVINYLAITTIYTIYDYYHATFQYNVGARTLYVEKKNDSQDFEELKNIEHVVFIASDKYLNGKNVTIPKFDYEDNETSVSLQLLTSNDNIRLTKGNFVKNNNEIICPNKFYPFGIFYKDKFGESNEKVIDSRIIDGNTLINKKIEFNIEDKKRNLKVVGTYDASIAKNESNICYISKKLYDEIHPGVELRGISEWVDGRIEYDYYYFTNKMIIVDDYKNVEAVKREILKNNYFVMNYVVVSQNDMIATLSIPIFALMVLIIISITVSISFVKKKIKNNANHIGLLKTVGYTDKEIVKIDTSENIIVLVIACASSCVLSSIIIHIVTNTYLGNFKYYNVIFSIPYLYIIIFSIIMILIISLFQIKKIKKSLNKCVQSLVNGK